MRVLIADDSDTQRAQLAGLLRRAGHAVVEFSDGKAALDALLEPSGPHVALLDWEMPGLDGIEVCRSVRAAELAIRPHLILLTARSERDDAVEGLRAGADDFLSKPPFPAELMARLKVGQRTVELQLELAQRTKVLEQALGRLDAVSVVASRLGLEPASTVERFEAILERELTTLSRGLAPGTGAGLSRAHAALVLRDEATWVDVVLEQTGAGSLAVQDLLTLVVQRSLEAMRAAQRDVLSPFGSRLLRQTPVPSSTPVQVGDWRLWIDRQPLEAAEQPFSKLGPDLVLLRGLKPPSMAGGEVLQAGTVLTASHLQRSRVFFQGQDAEVGVEVATPSPYARAAS